MANTANAVNGIKESWTLLAFAKTHGKMQVGNCTNKTTGEIFKSCIFTDPKNVDNKTFVSFSPKLGALTPQEIVAQKDDLQVVQWENEEGHTGYSLCHRGQGAWEDVELGI